MDCTVGGIPRKQLLVIRDHSLSRLGSEGLATAYEVVLPYLRQRGEGSSTLARIKEVQRGWVFEGAAG